jgi:hypothetical protein
LQSIALTSFASLALPGKFEIKNLAPGIGFIYRIIDNTYFMVNAINEKLTIAGEGKNNLRYNFQLLFGL